MSSSVSSTSAADRAAGFAASSKSAIKSTPAFTSSSALLRSTASVASPPAPPASSAASPASTASPALSTAKPILASTSGSLPSRAPLQTRGASFSSAGAQPPLRRVGLSRKVASTAEAPAPSLQSSASVPGSSAAGFQQQHSFLS